MAEALEVQWGRTLGPYMRVAVLCGGPGLKREATMDYARTVVAQLDTLARFGDGAALPLTHHATSVEFARALQAAALMPHESTALELVSSAPPTYLAHGILQAFHDLFREAVQKWLVLPSYSPLVLFFPLVQNAGQLLAKVRECQCIAAVRDGFRWLDTEKYGISVTPYFFGASGRVYPLTIEQLHAKSADDLEFDLSQQAEDPGYSVKVCTGACLPCFATYLCPTCFSDVRAGRARSSRELTCSLHSPPLHERNCNAEPVQS